MTTTQDDPGAIKPGGLDGLLVPPMTPGSALDETMRAMATASITDHAPITGFGPNIRPIEIAPLLPQTQRQPLVPFSVYGTPTKEQLDEARADLTKHLGDYPREQQTLMAMLASIHLLAWRVDTLERQLALVKLRP